MTLERLERDSACLLDRLAARPRLAAAVLSGLALFTYLPGVFLLPPVDRTEIVYAQSSRGMLERGTLIDSSYEGERVRLPPHRHLLAAGGRRPRFSGAGARDAIATYRLPSLIAGMLAVLAMWWLTRPLLGERRAIIAAALFAVSPIVALQATLSIPEGPLLLAIVVAQLTLLRLYCASTETATSELVAGAGVLGGAGRRHPAQCAGGADPVAVDDRRALRIRPPRSTGCGACARSSACR